MTSLATCGDGKPTSSIEKKGRTEMTTIHSVRKPLLSYRDLDDQDLDELLSLAADVAANGHHYQGILRGHGVGLLFTKPSTRTRTSFWRAATDLGADVIAFGPGELQLTTGESWSDTGDVLAQYLDAVVIRTNARIADMRTLAGGLPATVNAMSNCEHPTQALSDVITINEHFGHISGCRLAYLGEGNNTAAALALLLTRIPGTQSDFYCPPGYGLSDDVAATATRQARQYGAQFRFHDEIPAVPRPADVVYTTRWLTLGVERDSDWLPAFEPFRVDKQVFEKFADGDRTVFMHDLPAVRGEEVSGDVLDGPRSIALRQAHHKRTGAMTSLLWALGIRK
jgi:ornithine carbamoyltransferase